LTRRLSRAWSSYKYRFVPWIALNLNEKTAVKAEQSDIYSQEELVESLVITLSALEQYTSWREDLTLYDSLHVANQVASCACTLGPCTSPTSLSSSSP